MAGHVRKRPSGSYQAIAAFRDETGRLVQLTRTCPTKKEADDALPDLLKAARQRVRPASPQTLSDLLDAWWEVHAPKLAESTRRVDKFILDKHIKGRIGNIKLRNLTAYHIDRLYNDLAAASLGAHAIRHVHNILHRALRQGVKWKWLPENPAADASPPSMPKQKGHMPTPAEFEKLLQAADEHSDWFGIYLRLTTIMAGRRGEVTALRWGDFHPETQTITVDEALAIGDRGVIVKGPKEADSDRVLNIGPAMTELLSAYRDKLNEARETFVGHVTDRDFMFTFAPGATQPKPINPATATRTFKKVREAAGMPGIRLHDMRKVASTWLIGQGISVPTVSHRLGHSRNSTTHTTLDVYTRRNLAEDREAGEMLDRMVNGPVEKAVD